MKQKTKPMPKKPSGVMSKKDDRGEYATEEGNERGRKRSVLDSYVEGTKPNSKLAMKTLTPRVPKGQKKK